MKEQFRPRLTKQEYDLIMGLRNGRSEFEEFLDNQSINRNEVKSTKFWQTQNGDVRFSIVTKPEEDGTDYMKVRDDVIDDMMAYAPDYSKFQIAYPDHRDPHLLIISPSDVHVGKLASSEEGGEYNSQIAIERMVRGVDGIIQKARGFDIDEIVIIIGNDILHVDNAVSTTTKGTHQDSDGMWHENYKLARHAYVGIIEQCSKIAPVRAIFAPSNHDYVSGFMMADALSCWFYSHPHVLVDGGINHRKYFRYGDSMVGISHGDGAKEAKLPMLMATENPIMWSETKFRYIYLGHYHHKIAKDVDGVTIEYTRSPTTADSWHHRNGYVDGLQAIEGFIHHKRSGQIARLTHLF